jgi:hypothetical protein
VDRRHPARGDLVAEDVASDGAFRGFHAH